MASAISEVNAVPAENSASSSGWVRLGTSMVIGFLLANLSEWPIRRLAHFPLSAFSISAFLDFSLICTCRPADLHGLQACPAYKFEVQPVDFGWVQTCAARRFGWMQASAARTVVQGAIFVSTIFFLADRPCLISGYAGLKFRLGCT